jgi:hypothetical protein
LQDDFRQTTKNELKRLPIREIRFSTTAVEREQNLSEVQHTYVQELNSQRFEFSGLIASVGASLPFLTDGSHANSTGNADVVRDFLAYLARQMLDLNRQKHAEEKRYLGWLESELRVRLDAKGNKGVEALSGKTIFKNYLGDY